MGWEFRSGLAGQFGFEVSCEIVAKTPARAAAVRRLDWAEVLNAAGEEELPVGRGLSSSPCDLIHRAVWASSRHGGWILQSEWSKGQPGRSHDVLAVRVTHHHFYNIPLAVQLFATRCSEGTKQCVNTGRGVRIAWGRQEAGTTVRPLALSKSCPSHVWILVPPWVPQASSYHSYSPESR